MEAFNRRENGTVFTTLDQGVKSVAMAVGSPTAILAWQIHVIAFELVSTSLKSVVCNALKRQVTYFH